MRSFVSAPSNSQCGPESSSTRGGDLPATPLTSFLRNLTSDPLQCKQKGSDTYSTTPGGILFADQIRSTDAIKQLPFKSTEDLLASDHLDPRESSTLPIRVDEFHYQQRSNERIESMALNRRQSSEDYTFSNPTVEQGLTIEHQPTLSPLLIPGATAMPWMNYRNQNQTVPSSSSSYRQRDLTSTEISSTVVPSSSTTKSVSFDVQLTREEFLFQLSAKPEEYRPLELANVTPNEPTTSKDALLDQIKARELVEKLRSVGNENLNQSEFMQFVEQLAHGSISIQANQVVDQSGNEIDWSSRDMSNDGMIKHLEAAWAEAKDLGFITEKDIEKFRAAMNSSTLLNPLTASSLHDSRLEDILNAEMNTNFGLTEDRGSLPTEHQGYIFQKSNPYLQQAQQSKIGDVDLLGLALQFIREGKNSEAIRVLEAEVQRNSESSEGWRLLGQVHADNEQDAEAIMCLKKGHNVDPFNLSSLLILGVSLANEMVPDQALGHLRTWLSHHERFEHLVPAAKEGLYISSEKQRLEITELFNLAIAIDPENSELHIALGVIYNISRQFQRAFKHLVDALHCGPSGELSSIWNKIGATLANAGYSDAAVLAYHQALALKPNYPRAWTNLGIAHANLDLFNDAIRFYLSALSLNPSALHLWHHIRTAVLHMGRYELLGRIDNRNIQSLKQEFLGVVEPDSLPSPSQTTSADKDRVIQQIRDVLPAEFK